MWLSHFAAETSPLGAAGRRPTIRRQASNPENYFFVAERVAFFDINRPDRESYVRGAGRARGWGRMRQTVYDEADALGWRRTRQTVYDEADAQGWRQIPR